MKYAGIALVFITIGGFAFLGFANITARKHAEALVVGPAVKIARGSTVRVYGRLIAKHDDGPTTYVLTFNGTPADEELAPATAAELEELFKAKP